MSRIRIKRPNAQKRENRQKDFAPPKFRRGCRNSFPTVGSVPRQWLKDRGLTVKETSNIRNIGYLLPLAIKTSSHIIILIRLHTTCHKSRPGHPSHQRKLKQLLHPISLQFLASSLSKEACRHINPEHHRPK